MKLTDEYGRISCLSVIINREARQRTRIEVEDLKGSISQFGVLNPIIITKDRILVAGERRLTASLQLGLEDIPYRFLEDLSPIEAQIVELEENLKRADLEWRDSARATYRLHQLYLESNPDWTQDKTARVLSISSSLVSKMLIVAPELDSPKILSAPHLATAYNILSRRSDRLASDLLSDILEVGREIVAEAKKPEGAPLPGPAPSGPSGPTILPAEKSILQEDFLTWAPKYRGKPFNFIHCDFPYGIGAFGGAWSGRNSMTVYNDEEKTYFDLIRGLCGNLDRLMANSAHLMFWFSMEHYVATLELFRELAPSLSFSTFPLIWHKSDNTGIMPDPQRGPRRIYETCLMASRDDRLLVKSVANSYSAPTDRKWHPSTKPVPVLKHFMSMMVDDTTRMLDPTCGGGSSVRAAEDMGADFVLGLERDPEHCSNARAALREYRLLRSAK